MTLNENDESKEHSVLTAVSLYLGLLSGFTSLDSTASLHTNSNIFSFLVKSSLDKLETSCTVILSQNSEC